MTETKPFFERCKEVERLANQLYRDGTEWLVLFRSTLGSNGLARQLFPIQSEFERFEVSYSKSKIDRMIDIRRRESQPAKADPPAVQVEPPASPRPANARPPITRPAASENIVGSLVDPFRSRSRFRSNRPQSEKQSRIITVRMTEKLYEQLREEAFLQRVSLNSLCTQSLASALSPQVDGGQHNA